MALMKIQNEGGLPFVVLHGNFVARRRQMPDGDTVHFAATSPFRRGRVDVRVPVSADGSTSVALRLQSIDAPEKAQPQGASARDHLLRWLGFRPSDLGLSDSDFSVDDVLRTRPGWIASHGMDGNGRVLAYVFKGAPAAPHGQQVSATTVLGWLKRSGNHALCASGAVHPSFYNNTDESHAVVFQTAARKARAVSKGVWAQDRTTQGFVPTPDALDADGTLIYPKFFRRVQEWKKAKPDADAFIAWLKQQDSGKKLVHGAQRNGVPFWRLFAKVSAQKVAVPYDVTKLWFSE
jgi:endonuclease YncB( thermonuclease family)